MPRWRRGNHLSEPPPSRSFRCTPPRRAPGRSPGTRSRPCPARAGRVVRDLDFPDDGQRPPAQLDEVPLVDLRVVEVEVDAQVGRVDRLDEADAVGGRGERGAGVVDATVEILQLEDDALALAEFGDGLQGEGRTRPHGPGDLLARHDRQSVGIEAGAVEVEPRIAEAVRDRHTLLCGREQSRGARRVGERAAQVARHRPDDDPVGAGAAELGEVVATPIPDLRDEAEVTQSAQSLPDRQIVEDELGAHRERERTVPPDVGCLRLRRGAGGGVHAVTSGVDAVASAPRRTVPPLRTESMQARAIRSAARASRAPTSTADPSRTARQKAANSAT